MYRAAADARPADWVVASLRTFAESVLSLVPAGFEEYVRVFNPAYRGSWSDRVPVRWAEVARANGMQMHPLVQFGSITGHERYEWKPQSGVFDEPPGTGSIDRSELEPRRHRLPLFDEPGTLGPSARPLTRFCSCPKQ